MGLEAGDDQLLAAQRRQLRGQVRAGEAVGQVLGHSLLVALRREPFNECHIGPGRVEGTLALAVMHHVDHGRAVLPRQRQQLGTGGHGLRHADQRQYAVDVFALVVHQDQHRILPGGGFAAGADGIKKRHGGDSGHSGFSGR
ncbi:hypothetical protein AWV80_13905 [Cupriavidus sp. UYMU48A]|nr:hypothetical protein AWV80_13905 [Cupriavidus sp. UYMU48A]